MHYAKQEGWFCFFPVLPPVFSVNQSKGLVQFLGGGGRGDDGIERTYIVEGAQGHRGDRRRQRGQMAVARGQRALEGTEGPKEDGEPRRTEGCRGDTRTLRGQRAIE
jgi:hypothetical protein